MPFQETMEFPGIKPDALTLWTPIKLDFTQSGHVKVPAPGGAALATCAFGSVPKLLLEGAGIKLPIMAQGVDEGIWEPHPCAGATTHSGVAFRNCGYQVGIVVRALRHGF